MHKYEASQPDSTAAAQTAAEEVVARAIEQAVKTASTVEATGQSQQEIAISEVQGGNWAAEKAVAEVAVKAAEKAAATESVAAPVKKATVTEAAETAAVADTAAKAAVETVANALADAAAARIKAEAVTAAAAAAVQKREEEKAATAIKQSEEAAVAKAARDAKLSAQMKARQDQVRAKASKASPQPKPQASQIKQLSPTSQKDPQSPDPIEAGFEKYMKEQGVIEEEEENDDNKVTEGLTPATDPKKPTPRQASQPAIQTNQSPRVAPPTRVRDIVDAKAPWASRSYLGISIGLAAAAAAGLFYLRMKR